MLKPSMPNIPGVGAVTDTLDFVKNLWGSMGVPGISLPGMVAPTMSVDELDKKIADLKAVEAWLNVNGSMLRGTIQALEVQRGTIATLKSMGAALASAVKQPGANEKSVLAAAPYASAFFAQPAAPAPAPAPPTPAIETAPAAAGVVAAGLASPNLWWNLLQDQFKQAVSTAMSSDVAGKLAAASRPSAETDKGRDRGAAAPAAKDKAVKAPARKRAAPKPKTL